MPREIKNMSDHELLSELVQQGRRREKTEMIKLCLIVVLLLTIILLAVIYVPKIVSPIRQLSQSMKSIEEAAKEAERVLGSLDEDTMDKFKQTVESLTETSQQARVFMEMMMESGLDKLQSTIEALSKSLDSFMKFFGRS